MRKVGARWIEDDDIYAAILRAALRRFILGHRMKFGIASGGEARCVNVIVLDEKLDHFCGTRAGEFPIGVETLVVDWNVVGVAFDAEEFGTGAKNRG